MDQVRVIELFAGVGGFRIGLERVDKSFFKTVWANQWEPATKIQHAAMVYEARFGKGSVSNMDINEVSVEEIPDHDMLVGGFPCQDYSVASTLSNSKGIEGKKGVLWWSIYKILSEKGERRPRLIFLENVDRLLLSPANQRGRDFAIILECLNELGYVVEWRVINAAEYAMPQRRRRTYIVASRPGVGVADGIADPMDWLIHDGVFAKAFPVMDVRDCKPVEIQLSDQREARLVDISKNFGRGRKHSPFGNSGLMKDGVVYTLDTIPDCRERPMTLGDVIAKGNDTKYVTQDFYISDDQIEKWKYYKGAKREPRMSKTGFPYVYSEGDMSFPDPLDRPSRTIITSEGGHAPDRCRHVIMDQTGRLRRLIPLELERLNMFPDNHTLLAGVDDSKRAFLMGNALVCGIVTKVGLELKDRLSREPVQNDFGIKYAANRVLQKRK